MSGRRTLVAAGLILLSTIVLVGLVIVSRAWRTPESRDTTESREAESRDGTPNRSGGSVPSPSSPQTKSAPQLSNREHVERLLTQYKGDPGSLLTLGRNAGEQRQLRAALLAYAILVDPADELLVFVENDSLPEADRIFALACYAMDRRKFATDSAAVWSSLTGDFSMPNAWATRKILDPEVQNNLWSAGSRSAGFMLFDAVIDITTEVAPNGRGRTMPVTLGRVILDLARHAEDADGLNRAGIGLAYLAYAELDPSLHQEFYKLVDEALVGEPSALRFLSPLALRLVKDREVETLIDWYRRALSPDARYALAFALNSAVDKTIPAVVVSFLEESVLKEQDRNTKGILIATIGKLERQTALSALMRVYEQHPSEPVLQADALDSMSTIKGLDTTTITWVITRAQEGLLRLVDGPRPSSDDEVESLRTLTSILVRHGNSDQLVLLRNLRSGRQYAHQEVATVLDEAVSALEKRLDE